MQTVRRAAVVMHPGKVDERRLRELVTAAESRLDWGPTLWFETDPDDNGRAAVAEALDAGASVVLAAGGDGTVRAVADVLRGGDIPLALIPAGTGNLLARNLGCPLEIEAAVLTAFTGRPRAIDVGHAEYTRDDGSTASEPFLVMAGVGLDARMLAETNPALKRAVGWLAYLDGGLRALASQEPMRMRYRLDAGHQRALSAYAVIVGNCGALQGGVQLFPDAVIDDGLLDVVALQPRGRLGWLRVWGIVSFGRRRRVRQRGKPDLRYWRGRRIELELGVTHPFEVDGDELGDVTEIVCTVDKHSLRVIVPV